MKGFVSKEKDFVFYAPFFWEPMLMVDRSGDQYYIIVWGPAKYSVAHTGH